MKCYRLALYDPCNESMPPRFAGPVFYDTPEDRREMAKAIRKFNQRIRRRPDVTYCAAAFQVTPLAAETV